MDTEVKTTEVRRHAWAGQFYPASPSELSREIARLFAAADKPAVEGDVIGVVAPHAGYSYSGQVAASAYKLLEGYQYDSVIVVSPSHTKYFSGISIYNGGSYETPLGTLQTDVHLARQLTRSAPNTIYLSNMGHTGGERAEHALEVQLPFLQIVLGSFKLVAVVMGDQQAWRMLGDALAAAAAEGRTLLVASTDLSHYHPAREAERLDGAVRRAVAEFECSRLADVFESGKGEACGAGPMLACMHAARKLGADHSVVTGYAHSGQVAPDDEGVVGYLGAAFLRGSAQAQGKVYALDDDALEEKGFGADDRAELLGLARQAVAAAVYGNSPPDTSHVSRSLRARRGAFVTIKTGGVLRGCIGTVEGSRPVVETVVKMAQAAASSDPRFEPLNATELSDTEIEVSVLGPIEKCEDVELLEIGRHGLLIRKGRRTGVLLPQVAAEHGWDRSTFLQQVCVKAGLPGAAWRDSAATLYIFEAEVF